MGKKTKQSQVVTPAPSKEDAKPSLVVTFDAFFSKCIAEGRVKPWQQNEIAAFFKDMKLQDKEDIEVYEATLRKY